MVSVVAAGLVGALVASVATTVALAAAGWRERHTPGAKPFVALMVVSGVYAFGYLVALTVAPGGRILWDRIQWFGIAFLPVTFLAFAIEYLGYGDWLRSVVAVTGAPAVLTLALVWTNPWHRLLFVEKGVASFNGLLLSPTQFGPGYWAFLVYSYALIAVASFMLVRFALTSDDLYLDQSTLLVVGVAVPVAGTLLNVYRVPAVPGFDATPFAFTIAGVAFGNALFRYRLFELVPATRRIGHESAVAALGEGFVIVDTDQTVLYLNEAAADIFDVAVDSAVGQPVTTLVEAGDVAFDSPDAMGELELDGRTYEVRSSDVRDRHDRLLGYALVFSDVTRRTHRERALQRQRDELRMLTRLNGVIRSVNQALVAAHTREEIESVVSDRLTESELYDAAWTVDETLSEAQALPETASVRSDGGEAVAARFEEGRAALSATTESRPHDPDRGPAPEEVAGAEGLWTTVPIVYGRTVFGVLVLFTTREDAFGERELAVLDELGEAIGHAVHAAHADRVTLVDDVVELTFASAEDALARAATAADCSLAVEGLAPAGDGALVAYCRSDGGDPSALASALEGVPDVDDVARVDDALFECRLTSGSIVFPLREFGADVVSARVQDDCFEVEVRLSADADVRRVVDRVQSEFPEADLRAKRHRDAPPAPSPLPEAEFTALTDRQREAIETAYSAGYFEWPRDATAEDVADSMDISAPTFHNHLRKAQNRLLSDLLQEQDP